MLEPYDAKENQSCRICGFELSNNKQGRFTLHLKKEHHLSLEKYLINYYYKPEDLKCFYELCDNTVKLYRGKPNKFCSISCGGKGTPLVCVVCGNKFDTSIRPNRNTKTCSNVCAKKIKSKKIKAWHKSMTNKEKTEHFKNIITKTARTRKKNHTASWNSGKTGIYSEDTIEKIRTATLKQMENQVFRKTNIEKIIEEYLKEKKITYKYSFILEKRQFDFVLLNYQVIIECDGDYWHANPKFYPNPEKWQIKRITIDHEKDRIAKRNGYKIVRFWEDDILNNFERIKSLINDLLATTELETVDVKAKKQ